MARTLEPRVAGHRYPPAGDWQTIPEMAAQLGVGYDWVKDHIDKLPYEPEWRESREHGNSRVYPHYPPQCFLRLKPQARQLLQRPLLGDGLTLLQAAEELGRSRGWIVKTIKSEGLTKPRLHRSPNNRLVMSITRTTLKKLRQLQLPLPKPGWRNLYELHLETGWPLDTIAGRLRKAGYEPAICRSPGYGQSGCYFPPEVLAILGKKVKQHSAGGSWYTATRMGEQLNRTIHWLEPRLAHPAFVVAGEPRLDDSGTTRLHYPMWVLHQLRHESDSIRLAEFGREVALVGHSLPPRKPGWMYPPAKNWQTIPEMTKRLGISRTWIRTRVANMDYGPEWRQDRRSKYAIAYPHYPPLCYRQLRKEARYILTRPALGNNFTIWQAAEELGCSDEWIRKALEDHNMSQPIIRRTTKNRLVPSISPNTLKLLRRLQLPLPQPGWQNIHQLVRETGWSKNAVARRLRQAGYEASKCRSPVSGRSASYYPPEVLQLLGTKPRDIPPGGNWLTAWRMECLLGRPSYWVRLKLTNPPMAAAGETRRDDGGVPRQHYPLWVFRQLQAESEAQHLADTDQRAG